MGALFFRPETEEEALKLLSSSENPLIINGGTDAVLFLKEGKIKGDTLISIASIKEYGNIKEKDGWIEIGGTVTVDKMMSSPLLSEFSGLTEAMDHMASPAIRRMATAAGNICTAAPAADVAAMLYALGSSVKLKSIRGERIVPLSSFYNTKRSYSTVMEKDEILTSILIPSLQKGEGTGYTRLSRRKSQDIAKVMVGVRLKTEKGLITSASISLGAVNAQLVHGTETEKAIIGMNEKEAYDYAFTHFPEEAQLHESYYTEYKKAVLPSTLAETIKKAFLSIKEEER